MNLRISITKGPDSGRQIQVTGKGMRIGWSPACELCLTDKQVPPHAATVVNSNGQLSVYPVGDAALTLAGKPVGAEGEAWRPSQVIALGQSELQLVPDLPAPQSVAPPATSPSPQSRLSTPDRSMPLAQPSTASAKAKSDVTQYALIGVILLAALGIVLLPDGAGLETSSQSTIRLPDLLNELGQLPDESVSSGGPTMGEIRNQLWDGYRSQGSPTSARKHYARAMELLMMRVVTSPANDQAPAPDPIQAKYRAPVRFRTELEYKIYDYLRGQLKAK